MNIFGEKEDRKYVKSPIFGTKVRKYFYLCTKYNYFLNLSEDFHSKT